MPQIFGGFGVWDFQARSNISKFHPKSELWRPVALFFQGVWGLSLPGKVLYIKIPDISCPEANQAIYEVMVKLCMKISSKIRTLEASGPVFGGWAWGLRLPGKVQYIKIPNISCPDANQAIYKSSGGQPGHL